MSALLPTLVPSTVAEAISISDAHNGPDHKANGQTDDYSYRNAASADRRGQAQAPTLTDPLLRRLRLDYRAQFLRALLGVGDLLRGHLLFHGIT